MLLRAEGPGRGPAAIVAALPEELAPLLKRARAKALPGGRLLEGRLEGARVLMMTTGVGAVRAGAAARELLGSVRPRVLLGIGVAGGVSEDLLEGSLVASRDSDRDWVAAAGRAGAITATLLPVPEVASRDEKAALRSRAEGSAACDMESLAWAQAAEEHRVPHLVLRSILDAASDDLPGFLSAYRDEEGQIARGKVLRGALTHPSRIPDLLRLRARVERCAESLADCVESVIAWDRESQGGAVREGGV
jgi:adenosylhomocysteine nucleosidase